MAAYKYLRRAVLALVLAIGALVGLHASSSLAATGPCTAPSTDYGTVSSSVQVSGSGTYRVWTRMSAPDATNNTYMLEIDGSSCYTIGGSSVPTYANGAVTFFTNNATNWISKTNSGAQIDVNLTAGTHTIKMIGNAPGVVVDRLVLTQDTACVPTGTGDNCANPPDTTSPVVSITAPAQGASISQTTTVTANATDDVAVNKVEFYVDGALKGTDTTGSSNNYTYSLNPTTLSTGSHSLYAIAYDSSGNTTTSGTISFTVPNTDTTPPTISAVTSGSIAQTSATITWTTNEAADSQVAYGTSSSYGSATTLNTAMQTSHSVSLSGLTAGTTYHFKVTSKDASGNSASSADTTFTTQAPASDTTKPTVSVTAPSNNASVSGTVSITVTAADNVGVAGVQFKIDGANLGAEDTVSPYSTSWVTDGLASGTHTITAVARDAAGNTTTSSAITVTIPAITYKTGDINQDGVVDTRDFGLLKSKFNQTGASLGRSDINQDGIVDIRDFGILKSQFGI